MTKSIHSSSLFTMPSFFKGTARIVDIHGTLDVYNTKAEGYVADKEALARDWQIVGTDITSALHNYESNKE